MNEAQIAFEKQQAILREKYAVRSLQDAHRFQELHDQLAIDDSADVRQQIESLAHRMAGTSGTFGFHDLTPPAITLEEAVIAKRPNSEILQHLTDLIAKIRELMN